MSRVGKRWVLTLLAAVSVGVWARAQVLDETLEIESILAEMPEEVAPREDVSQLKRSLDEAERDLRLAQIEIESLQERLQRSEEAYRAERDRREAAYSGTDDLSSARAEVARLQEALKDLEEARLEESFLTHYNMGCVYKATRQYRRAEAEFLKGLSINPDDPGIHYNLGILYDDDLNEKDLARKHYERYLELAPYDRDAPKVQEWLSAL